MKLLSLFTTAFLVLGTVSPVYLGVADDEIPVNLAEEGDYRIDLNHSNVGFSVGHLGISNVIGRFNTFAGEFKIDQGGESSITAVIDVASVDTNVDRRDAHLRSADFFDASRFPRMIFKSTKVTHDEKGYLVSAEGDLSFHGFTKAVKVDIKPVGAGVGPGGKVRAGFQLTTVIDRTEFGMDFSTLIVSREIKISIQVEGIRK